MSESTIGKTSCFDNETLAVDCATPTSFEPHNRCRYLDNLCEHQHRFVEMSTPPPSLEKIPYTPLLLPISPIIQSLARLTKHLASYTHLSPCPTLWIAREDLNSGLAFGGNKIRKLEYVIPDAVSNGADTLVTTGGIQSNHMRQTAAVAAKLGMKVKHVLQISLRATRD